jgi:hypothetical protein
MEWEVQDILAARTSATGDDEMLVVWKPSWAPVSNIKDGPAIRRFMTATKWKFTSNVSGMRVILPVEEDTTLAEDYDLMQQMTAAAKSQRRSSHAAADAPRATGPRKSLGSVAKRRSQPIKRRSQPIATKGGGARSAVLMPVAENGGGAQAAAIVVDCDRLIEPEWSEDGSR